MSRTLLNGVILAGTIAVHAPSDARAQDVSGGVYAGMSMASLANEDAPSNRRVGARAGGFLDLGLTSLVGARLEGVYAMKGVESADSSVTVALDYLEIPVLARISLPGSVRPTVLTGPAFGVKVAAELQGPSGSVDYGDLVHTFDVGWTIGGGITTSAAGHDLLIDVRYTRGLTSVFNFGDPNDTDSNDKNQVVSVGIGLALF